MISCVALEVVAELTRRENTEREQRENTEKSRGSRILDGVKVLRILHVYDAPPITYLKFTFNFAYPAGNLFNNVCARTVFPVPVWPTIKVLRLMPTNTSTMVEFRTVSMVGMTIL